MLSMIKGWVTRNQLISFLLLAFGYTWLFQILVVLLVPASADNLGFYILSIYGPTISALVACLVLGGYPKLSVFLKRCLVWKASISWYLVALFGIAFLLLLIRLIHRSLFPTVPISPIQFQMPVFGLLTGYLFGLIFGPFGEELGWRGFALPLMQKGMNALPASLLLGVIWWAWHLPQLLIPELQWAVGGMPILMYLLMIVPGSVLATWLFNNTRGSVLLTILFHGSLNYSLGLLGFNSPYFIAMVIAALWVAAMLVTLIYGPKYLSRRKIDLSNRP